MNERTPVAVLSDFDRTTGVSPDPGRAGHYTVESAFDPDRMPSAPGLEVVSGYIRPSEARPVDAAWHGRIVSMDGTVVAESFQTRLTAQD